MPKEDKPEHDEAARIAELIGRDCGARDVLFSVDPSMSQGADYFLEMCEREKRRRDAKE